jgi:hypothetical protein
MSNLKITLDGMELRRVLMDGIEFLGDDTTRVICNHDIRLKDCNDLLQLKTLGHDVFVHHSESPDEIGQLHIILSGDYDLRITCDSNHT